MHQVYNLPFPSNSRVPKELVVKLAPILKPANLFACTLPPTWTLPTNLRRPGPYWRKFTTHKESINKKLDLPSLQLTTSGDNVATHTVTPLGLTPMREQAKLRLRLC